MTNSTDQDIFDTKPNGEGEPSASAANAFDDLLKGIKTEDGNQKYDTVEKALDGLANAQEHIRRLEADNKEALRKAEEAKAELSKTKTVEEFVASLKDTPKPNTPEVTNEGKGNTGVDAETIEKLLEQKLAQRASLESREKNLTSVVTEVSKLYGDKASEHIRNVANNLGTTTDKIKELASENPKMAMTLLGTSGSKPKVSPTQPSTNSSTVIPNQNAAPKFEKGAARGGFTDRELLGMWRTVGDYTNKRIGVTNATND